MMGDAQNQAEQPLRREGERQLRLECLRLAATPGTPAAQVLQAAADYEAFVLGGETRPA